MASSEYGRHGILGMLTPQANTTVEPEFWCLLPPDWSMINARLTSARGTIEERLVDYTTRFEDTAAQFANAPVSAIAIGCTGASYLIGREAEAGILSRIATARGAPVFTAGTAVVEALVALGAKRIGLVSPYPGTLDAACVPYWESFGFEVAAKAKAEAQADKFHPIYAMPGSGCLAALRTLEHADCDAIVLLGTGMPTLGPMLAVSDWAGPPAFSCNAALAWASVRAAAGQALDAASLGPWISGAAWGDRFRMLFPALAGPGT